MNSGAPRCRPASGGSLSSRPILALAAALLLGGCGSTGPVPALPREGPASLDAAIDATVDYALTVRDIPTFQALLQYAERRFGVAALAGARARYDGATSRPEEHVFRRLVDRNHRPEQAELTGLSLTDPMVAAALYCDIWPPGPDFAVTLETARRAGGYELTHVLLSLELMRENGCPRPGSAAFEDSVAVEVAHLAAGAGAPSDLEIESQAFLSLVGRDDLMQPGFVERLLGVQCAGRRLRGSRLRSR